MTRIGIFGASGRMGQAIAGLLQDSAEARLAGRHVRGEDPGRFAASADVLVDFSSPAALQAHLEAAAANATPILVGTTGLDQSHLDAIEGASHRVAVLRAANVSLGVAMLSHLVREAASRLGEDWDIEILDMHHRHKADAPSGTALMLGAAAAAGRGVDADDAADRGRDGITGPREPGRIGYAALRGGSVAGDHLVVFASEDERLELGHRAENRRLFARGAIRAATWLHGKPAGLYSMADVLGL